MDEVKEDSLYYDLLGQVLKQARIDYLRHVAMVNKKIKILNKANQFQHEIAGKDAEDFFFRANRLEDFLGKFQIDFVEPSFLRSQILNDVDLILEERSEYKIMRIIANTHELKRMPSREKVLLN
jgi:hypothetical protein